MSPSKSQRHEHRDCYFKDFGDSTHYISGLSIPKDTDGICRNMRFINCTFHAGCCVPYENCEFIDCDGRPDYKQQHQQGKKPMSKTTTKVTVVLHQYLNPRFINENNRSQFIQGTEEKNTAEHVYRVDKITNAMQPTIDATLLPSEVQQLIESGATVHIVRPT